MEDLRHERGALRPSLNFTAQYGNEYGDETPMKKSRMSRDPISHRIIEKRRRDRMNHCLAELSQLIPDKYLKQGQGRIEKTEIIELSIKHIKSLQARIDVLESGEKGKCCQDKFLMGFKECTGEVQRYLVETKGYPSDNPLCIGTLHHLQEQQKKFEGGSKGGTTLTAESVKGQDLAYLSLWSKTEGSSSAESTAISEDTLKRPLVSPDGSIVSVVDSTMRSNLVSPSTSSPKELEKYSDNSAIIRKIDRRLQTMLSHEGETQGSERMRREIAGALHSPCLSSNCWSDSGYSGSFSAKAFSEDSLQQDSESRKHINYKYKNDIKLRFTADTSDEKTPGSSESDMIFTKEEQSPPAAKAKDNPSPQNDGQKSDSTSYPSSDFSTNGHTSSGSNGNGSNGSNGESSSRSSSSPTMSSSSTNSGTSPTFDLANSVPGFALHPSGTYYIPVVSPSSQLMPYLQNYGTSGICHPISIPVNFGGPLVCMQKLRVTPQNSLGSGYSFKREGGHSSKRSSHSHKHL